MAMYEVLYENLMNETRLKEVRPGEWDGFMMILVYA